VIDPCEDVTCQGEQTCNNGVCGCLNGFEGIDCDMLSVGKFVGIWAAEDDCPSAGEDKVYAYISEIKNDENDQTKANVENFGNFGELSSWPVSVNTDTIRLPLSDVGSGVAEGLGVMTDDRTTINWIYTYTDENNNSEECIGIWIRQ